MDPADQFDALVHRAVADLAADAQLTAWLAEHGVQVADVQRTLDLARERFRLSQAAEGFVDAAFPDERPWEELELGRVRP